MTPALKRHIRLARHRIYGMPLSPLEVQEEETARAIDKFNGFLRNKMTFDVWLELLACGEFVWSRDGCSVEFEIDDRHFLLTQDIRAFRLVERVEKRDIPLQVFIDDDEQLGDRLLVAIGDAFEVEEDP